MTPAHDLDAAGVTDPRLRSDYLHCRDLAREHGRTYFLATRFLPPARRPAIHALYGFARTADDIVDDFTPGVSVQAKEQGLQELIAQFRSPGSAVDPSVRAALDTARRYDLSPQLFEDFLTSMQMDLTVTSYETHDDLDTYVWGSAAVIGLMVLPILGYSCSEGAGGAVRGRPRRRLPAQQLHPRRRRGPAAGPDLPADGVAAEIRCRPCPSRAWRGRRRRPRLAGIGDRAHPGHLSPRRTGHRDAGARRARMRAGGVSSCTATS